MGHFSFAITIILTVSSVFTLIGLVIVSTKQPEVSDAEQLINISRIVMAVFLLIVSFGLIPLTINYYAFSKKAEKSQQLATDLLKTDSDNIAEDEVIIQAIKAFNEYHLTRVSAPLIPTWLWKMKNDTLNEGWNQFVSNQR
jgi:amino acid transporter